MRILVVAPQPFYQDRGTPIVLHRVLDAMSEIGYEVDVITFPGGRDASIPRVRIARVGTWLPIREIPIGFSLRKLGLDILLLPAILSALRHGDYDWIHAVEESVFPAWIGARLHRLPIVYDMQSSLPEHLKQLAVFRPPPVQAALRAFERFVVRRVNIVACSLGLKAYVRTIDPTVRVVEWHYPALETTVPLPESADEALRGELGLAADAYVVLYTGNFAHYQGIQRLIEAIPMVLANIPQATFIFVGAESAKALQAAESFPSVRHALRVVPRQPRESIPQLMNLASVLISPRDSVGNLPLKVLDYMAAGKPIVATDSAAHRSVLNDASALLVEPSATGIAKGIIKLYQDKELAAALGEASRQFAREQLGWPTFVKTIRHIYEDHRNH